MSQPLPKTPADLRDFDETDRRILEAAVAHFARDGYGRTAVESIAASAQVGNGTVYRRFESKERLFLAALRHCLDSASAYVRQRIDGMTDPISTIRAIARLRAEYCTRHPEMVAMMILDCAEFGTAVYLTHLRGRHGNLHYLCDLMRRASLTARSIPVASPEEAAVAFMDLTFGAAINGYFDGDRDRLVQRTEAAVELFLRGLVGDGLHSDARTSSPATSSKIRPTD
jgi:AcrR family transcriptional regulator